MKKILVAYFSASGVTAAAAGNIARAIGADLYEIKPAEPYRKADLNWMNPFSRSTKEMKDKSSRPAIADSDAPVDRCDTILLGFPIWWYIAPTIINTFLERYDFTGKTVVLFATSGGSGFGETVSHLIGSCPGAEVKEGAVFRGNTPVDELASWASSLQL